MLLTITIDPARVEKFADPDETLVDFIRRVSGEARSGGAIAWTRNAANVGSIDRVTHALPAKPEPTAAQRAALRDVGQNTRRSAAPLDAEMLDLLEASAVAQADVGDDGWIEWTPDRGGMPGHVTYRIAPDGRIKVAMIG